MQKPQLLYIVFSLYFNPPTVVSFIRILLVSALNNHFELIITIIERYYSGHYFSCVYTDDLSEAASDLTSEDIADYLRFLKLDEYIKKFEEIDVDGITMLEIDNDTLETDLGVDTAKDRVKIKTKFKWWLRKRMAQKK